MLVLKQWWKTAAMSAASYTDSPLFLLNHWVADPITNPTTAARANTYDTLLSRAQSCAEARGQRPNFVVVDFHDQGDLFAVVDELNGLDPR